MNRLTVVTSFGAAGLDLYGKAFLNSFRQFWPKEVALRVYVDDDVPPLEDWVNSIPLQQASQRCADFLRRHKDNPVAKGNAPRPGETWSQKCIDKGHNFRCDAYKFCRKIFALEHAALAVGEGKLFWIDADVITHAEVPVSLLHEVLPDAADTSCLQRVQNHSECGFVGYNLSHPETRAFVQAFADLYAHDTVFELDEWHDSWVYDHLRQKFALKTHAIHPSPRKGQHVFDESVLGKYMDHLKGGRRKRLGVSPESRFAGWRGAVKKIVRRFKPPRARAKHD